LNSTTKSSGIRPEIPQTMVQLGLFKKEIIAYSSLHIAIKAIQAI